MKNKITLISIFLLLQSFFATIIFAQDNNTDVRAADFTKDSAVGELLKGNDKMTAVIIVISIIIIGLFLYLWRLDKKIDKLSK
jgi:hypothetical protein